jgi:hypothetical protein
VVKVLYSTSLACATNDDTDDDDDGIQSCKSTTTPTMLCRTSVFRERNDPGQTSEKGREMPDGEVRDIGGCDMGNNNHHSMGRFLPCKLGCLFIIVLGYI